MYDYLELDDIMPEKVIKFLFSKRYQGSWNFFYNVAFDAEVILKIFGDLLYDYKKTRTLKFYYNDYTIDYIPAKKITIRKCHHSTVFFDIANWWMGFVWVIIVKNRNNQMSNNFCSYCSICSSSHWSALLMTQNFLTSSNASRQNCDSPGSRSSSLHAIIIAL